MKEQEVLISQMESSWLAQLIREFENICYQYDLVLSLPIIQLTRSKAILGSWKPSERLLSLSAYLILNHPWPVTIQVLKHEMAHQVCSELFSLARQGHGPDFKKACAMLGVEPLFQSSMADSMERLTEGHLEKKLSPDHQLIGKVQKLMALGQSSNKYEAELAMEKAATILADYNLSLASIAKESELFHIRINTQKQRLPVHLRMIVSLLDKWFFVRVVITSIYSPLDDKTYKAIELFGSSENAATAEYCYNFLLERLEVFWRAYQDTTDVRQRISRKSYYMGLLTGFEENLASSYKVVSRQSRMQKGKFSNDLVTTESRVERFVEYYFPKLKRGRRRSMRVDRLAFDSGQKKGQSLTLNKPLKKGQKTMQLLE